MKKLNPYLESLARQKMCCPDCLLETYIKPSLNPNYAYEMCPNCGLLRTIVTPKNARVDPDKLPKGPAVIIKFEDAKNMPKRDHNSLGW
jgi:NMD protein affecting ribosome stability and mRNA decay